MTMVYLQFEVLYEVHALYDDSQGPYSKDDFEDDDLEVGCGFPQLGEVLEEVAQHVLLSVSCVYLVVLVVETCQHRCHHYDQSHVHYAVQKRYADKVP